MTTKAISDLIDENVSISWSGKTGSVTGDIKYVSGFSELFDKDEMNGNFFPLVLDDSYKGKQITVKRTSGNKSEKTVVDTEWILRLTDNEKTEFDVSSEDTKIAHLTFAGASLGTAVSVIPQDHNLGKYKKTVNELVTPDTKINADGSVTGTLKHIDNWSEFGTDPAKQSGNYLPVRLDSQFMNKTVVVQGEKTTTINVNTEADRDIIIRVKDKNVKFTFTVDDQLIMTLTFENTSLPTE